MDMDTAIQKFENHWSQYWSSKPKNRSGQAFRQLLENIDLNSYKVMDALIEQVQPASDKERTRLKLKAKYRELEESLVNGKDWALVGDYDPYKNFSKERIDGENEQIIAGLHGLWDQILEPINKLDKYISDRHSEIDVKNFHKSANKSLDGFTKDINKMESKDHMHHRFRQINILWEIKQLRKSLYKKRPEYNPINWVGVNSHFEKIVRAFVVSRENWTLTECINISFGYAYSRSKALFTDGQHELLRKAKSSMLSGLRPAFQDALVEDYQFNPSTFLKWLGTTGGSLRYAKKAEKWIHEERLASGNSLDRGHRGRIFRDRAHIECAILAMRSINELKDAESLTANKLASVMFDRKIFLESKVDVTLKSQSKMRELFASNIFNPIVKPAQLAIAQLPDGCRDKNTGNLSTEMIKNTMKALGLNFLETPDNALGIQRLDEVLSVFILKE